LEVQNHQTYTKKDFVAEQVVGVLGVEDLLDVLNGVGPQPEEGQ
jgi:hypothetical protein